MLTNREVASLILLGLAVIALFAFARSMGVWKDLLGLLRLVFVSRLALLWVGYLAYTAALVLVAHALGVWTAAMAAETALTVFGVGIPMLVSARDLPDARALGREVARRTVGPAVLMAAYVNLVSFSIPVEVIFQGCIGLVLVMKEVAQRSPATVRVGQICGVIAGAMGLLAIWHTTTALRTTWRHYDWGTTGHVVAMSVWFPLALAPVVYCLGYASTCSEVTRTKTDGGWRQPRMAVRLAVLVGLRLSLRLARGFRARNPDVGRAGSYRQASADVAYFRASRRRGADDTSAEAEW